jgi:hypothetical protein
MKTVETIPKILRMFYSIKELSAIMDMSYNTFRAELRRNATLHAKLTEMGWGNHKRLCKAHVLEIFRIWVIRTDTNIMNDSVLSLPGMNKKNV